MPDVADRIAQELKNKPRFDLDLGEEAIHPAYDDLSILNLPASLSQWLDGPEFPHPAIDLARLDDLSQGVKQVICVLIDGVSLDRYRRWSEGILPELDPQGAGTLLAALTSVVPATTCTALTSIWTGRSPAEHGILGYEMFLREYGLVANMITLSPMSFVEDAGSLYKAGFKPEKALPVPTLGVILGRASIEIHTFLSQAILHSGLSLMHYAGVESHGFSTPSDLWHDVRSLAERSTQRRRLIWVYYGNVDGVSHTVGPDAPQARAEFKTFLQAMRENFLIPFQSPRRGETLLLLLSDHGQIETPFEAAFEVRSHPDLVGRLHLLPTGENRLSYLYSRPGQLQAIEDYFQATWPGKFSLFPSEMLLDTGLFGPGESAEETPARLGDLTAISRGTAYLWWADKPNPLIGRHGGLSADEMLVPFLAARLG